MVMVIFPLLSPTLATPKPHTPLRRVHLRAVPAASSGLRSRVLVAFRHQPVVCRRDALSGKNQMSIVPSVHGGGAPPPCFPSVSFRRIVRVFHKLVGSVGVESPKCVRSNVKCVRLIRLLEEKILLLVCTNTSYVLKYKEILYINIQNKRYLYLRT